MLTCHIQTSPYSFHYSTHPPDHSPSRRLCTLLQTFSSICSNTCLRYPSSHIVGTNPCSRSIHVDTPCVDSHSSVSAVRSLILLFSVYICKSRPEYPSSTTFSRRNCIILLTYSPTEILTTTSAVALAQFSSFERAYCYCIQCGTYSGRNYMAHPTWTGIHSLCGRLESSTRECTGRCCMARRSWGGWSRGYRTTAKTDSFNL